MAKKPFEIKTPRGRVYHFTDANGKVTSKLEWNINFKGKWGGKYGAGQKAVDNAVLKDCDPFIAKRTGMLIDSGILGTVPGDGVVSWIAPYARKHYYTPRKTPNELHPQAGPFWFEKAKALFKRSWLELFRVFMRKE